MKSVNGLKVMYIIFSFKDITKYVIVAMINFITSYYLLCSMAPLILQKPCKRQVSSPFKS